MFEIVIMVALGILIFLAFAILRNVMAIHDNHKDDMAQRSALAEEYRRTAWKLGEYLDCRAQEDRLREATEEKLRSPY